MSTAIFRIKRFVLITTIAGLIGQLWLVPSPTHSQEESTQRIESDDPSVQQAGAWVAQTSPNASGGSYLYSSGDEADVLTLEFAGTAIEIVYVAGPSLGTLAVEVDDTVLRTVITTTDSTAYQQITRIDYLTDELHTLKVYAQEGGIIGVDAFWVTLGGKPEAVTVNNTDRETRATSCSPTNAPHRVSLTSTGSEPNNDAYYASLSADGRYVAFDSEGPLMPGDGDTFNDIYVYDRQTCTLELISVSTEGVKGNSTSSAAKLSDDGRYVAFYSTANNLVANDTNGLADIFVRDRLNAITTRVSVSSSGVEGNGASYDPDLSADGRLIVFESNASNLVANDTNSQRDIFLHNRNTGNTVRISLTSLGAQATGGGSSEAVISANGRYVAFESEATNLVLSDLNNDQDIFVRDRQANTTTRVSVPTGGGEADAYSYQPAISNDGNLIAFASMAENLVPNDTNSSDDVFLHDRAANTTTRISVGIGGTEGDFYSIYPAMSDDGRYIVYESAAENLVTGDSNAYSDIFVWDRTLNTTTRVSLGVSGGEADQGSYDAAISANGQYIAFDSNANNLVPGDTNTFYEVYVTSRVQPADDTLALFNPPYNQVNLIDTLADTPPYTAYTAFSAYAPVSGGTWVMGDWNGDGLDTPGLYLNYVFYYTNTSGESASADWGGFWIGVNGPPVAGRFSSTSSNDCIGAVDSAPYSGMTIFALYFTCDFSGVNPAPPLTFQWLSAPLPDPTFTGTFQFMAGDFNGDGLDSVAVRRGEFIAFGNVNPAAGPAIFDLAQYIGAPGTGDIGSFVVGDWDGNGLDSFGLFYQNGEFFYRNDLDFNTGVYLNQSVGTPFGTSGVQVASWR